MADLFPTPTRLALLRDIRDGRVRDDDNLTPMLHYEDDGEAKTARVADIVWSMGRAGWCQPTDTAAWELTDAGRAVLAAADGPAECLGPDMDCGRPRPCPDHPAGNEPEAVIDPGEGMLT